MLQHRALSTSTYMLQPSLRRASVAKLSRSAHAHVHDTACSGSSPGPSVIGRRPSLCSRQPQRQRLVVAHSASPSTPLPTPVPVSPLHKQPKEHWWEKDCPPNMIDIHSTQELVDALADAGDKLVVLDFYATWCNACRALFPKICRLVGENPETVLFLKINFDENRDMARTMSVKVLPYFHFYRGAEGRVDAFSCTLSKLTKFRDAVDMYSSPFCSLEPTSGIAEFPTFVAHPERLPSTVLAPAEPTVTHLMEDELLHGLHPQANTPSVVAAQ